MWLGQPVHACDVRVCAPACQVSLPVSHLHLGGRQLILEGSVNDLIKPSLHDCLTPFNHARALIANVLGSIPRTQNVLAQQGPLKTSRNYQKFCQSLRGQNIVFSRFAYCKKLCSFVT